MKKVCKAIYIIIIAVCAFAVMGAAYEPTLDEAELDPITVVIKADGKSFTYTDKKILPSDFTVSEQITARKINAPLEQKLDHIDACIARGADYKTALMQCFPLLIRTVKRVSDSVSVLPTDAEIVYKNGVFSVTKDKKGKMLDEQRLYAEIYCALKFTRGGTVKAHTVDVLPAVTTEKLKSALTKRGTYTTDYKSSTADRAHNIRLALSKIDGTAIAAGETLSFNKTVGERTERNGFKSAKIIVDGKYTDGIGGGVCQASTAVYNAALRAGLSCHANAHSICPSYCAAGLDAMISSVSDLLITNNTSDTVFISARSHGGMSTVTIYGERSEYTYVPESVIVGKTEFTTTEITDTDRKYFDIYAHAGERLLVSPGKDGVSSETFLNVIKNGVAVKRIKLRDNTYKSLPRIIAVAP